MAVTIEKTVDSGKTVFDISVNTYQICMGLKQISRKENLTCPSYKDPVKTLYTSNGCSSIIFLTISLSESR